MNKVDTNLIKSNIPSRIIGPQCRVNDTEFYQVPYEDFVLPGREQMYRIHPFYLQQQPILYVQVCVCDLKRYDRTKVQSNGKYYKT